MSGGDITAKLSSGQPNIPPSQERTASKKDNKDRKEMMLTMRAATKLTEEMAPLDAASNTLVQFLRRTYKNSVVSSVHAGCLLDLKCCNRC